MQPNQLNNHIESSEQTEPSSEFRVAFNQDDVWEELEASHKAMLASDEAVIKSEVQSPRLALSYAQAIAHSWRKLNRQGAIDHNHPCYLIELEAGSGQFAVLLLNRLKSILTAREWRLYKPRYLLADSRRDKVSECWQHTSLRYWIEQGNLEPVEFDVRHQRVIDLKSRRLILGPNSFINPLVVIANGVFSSLRQSLYNIHYGKLFTAELTHTNQPLSKDPKEESVTTYNYHWREVHGLENIGPAAQRSSAHRGSMAQRDEPVQEYELVQHYLHRLDSGLVLIPEQAFTAIERLADLADNGLLLLSSDRGFYQEQSLREQPLPEMGPYARYFLPFNGHALRRYIESRGGETTCIQSSADQALQSITWHSSSQSTRINTHDLTSFFGEDNHAFTRQMFELSNQNHHDLTANQLLALLQFSQFDHQILFTHLTCLYESLAELDSVQRRLWRDALRSVWQQYYPFPQDHECLLSFAVLALRLGALSTARDCLTYLTGELPQSVNAKYYLAICQMQLGERATSDCTIQRCLNLSSECDDLVELRQQLKTWRAQCDSDACYDEQLNRDRTLSLHPLAPHYADDFLYQYRDPSIGVMTSLPEFADIDAFDQWLEQHTEIENESVYAVVHSDFGFVGHVSLKWHGQNGFFYFWIGTDYQSQGYGQRAAQLLFRMAESTLGVANIYTAVFDDNSRSKSALLALSFKELPFKAKKPDDAYVFFTTDQGSSSHCRHSLIQLLTNIESPVRLENA